MMRTRPWIIVQFALLFLFLGSPAWPQALPAAQPDRVNRAVSGVLQEGMRSRGFAANDPRFGNTLARISPVLTSVASSSAAAITFGAVTAPAWASVAIAAGISAVVAYSVSLGIDALVNWLFRDDGLIDQSSESSGERDPSNGVKPGIPLWRSTVWTDRNTSHEAWGGDGIAMAKQSYHSWKVAQGEEPQDVSCSAHSDTVIFCELQSAVLDTTGTSGQCEKGSFYVESQGCMAYSFPVEGVGESKSGLTPQKAIDNIPAEDLDKQLNPAIVAALANQAWQQAASQPNYDGLPYSQSNPITQAEVEPWTQANPEYAPTVRDFVSPNPSSSTSSQPWALPSNPTVPNPTPSTPNANSTNPASENPQQNLGPDPGIGSPTLEQTPTAEQIAKPILDLLPDFKNFHVDGKAGACPTPTLELWGTHIVADTHCKIMEDNKAAIQAAMAFAWAALALFIILSA